MLLLDIHWVLSCRLCHGTSSAALRQSSGDGWKTSQVLRVLSQSASWILSLREVSFVLSLCFAVIHVYLKCSLSTIKMIIFLILLHIKFQNDTLLWNISRWSTHYTSSKILRWSWPIFAVLDVFHNPLQFHIQIWVHSDLRNRFFTM